MLIGGASLMLLLSHCEACLNCVVVSSGGLYSWTLMLRTFVKLLVSFCDNFDCACVRACVCVCVCLSVCLSGVCMHACVYVYACMYICVRVCLLCVYIRICSVCLYVHKQINCLN